MKHTETFSHFCYLLLKCGHYFLSFTNTLGHLERKMVEWRIDHSLQTLDYFSLLEDGTISFFLSLFAQHTEKDGAELGFQ